MAFFNFRRDGAAAATTAASPSQPETADVVRRRAKHRLIGSAVLVLAGVIGFPLLFDTQPRPVAVDIPIEIPSRNTTRPAAVAPAPSNNPRTPAPDRVTPDSSLSPSEEIMNSRQAAAPATAAPAMNSVSKPNAAGDAKAAKSAMASDKAVDKTAEKSAEPAAAKPAAKPAAGEGADERVVVQVGAFSDTVKAREARVKLEKAGLKSYTQVAETKDGKRIRVRVGPFATRADAEKAASKIKTLDLPASILTL